VGYCYRVGNSLCKLDKRKVNKGNLLLIEDGIAIACDMSHVTKLQGCLDPLPMYLNHFLPLIN
jgi:hypothetical protein